MKRSHWMVLGATLALAASAHATARSLDAARAMGYDIVTQNGIPANATCGHAVLYDGDAVLVDWAVNGVVVAQDVEGVNYTNDGAPYTVAVGQVSGGLFTEYYSEIFYPGSSSLPHCRLV